MEKNVLPLATKKRNLHVELVQPKFEIGLLQHSKPFAGSNGSGYTLFDAKFWGS